MKTHLSAQQARTENQICSLRRDNYDSNDFGILISETTIYLSEHKSGEQRRQNIAIPRKHFDKLIRWYQKPQKTVKRK